MDKQKKRHSPTEAGTTDYDSETGRRIIINLLLAVLISLVAGVILISRNLMLPAGLLVLIASAGILLIYRRSSSMLNRLSKRLEETSESSGKKDTVITDFSHRIREPLNTLVILGDLLMKSGPDEKQKELIETLVASTKNMVDTVNQLTMESGGISYEGREKIRFNLYSTIQNTIELFKLLQPPVLNFLPPDQNLQDYHLIGDPIVVKQILLDLFNLLEAGSRDYPTGVKVAASRDESRGDGLYIRFTISTDKRTPLPADNETLNHAARIIEDAGGSYAFDSLDKTTILSFSLPFIPATTEEKKTIASPRIDILKTQARPSKNLRDANILLVEDNQINQKITMLTLKPLVRSIDTATNGREALEKFGSFKYDLILMDIQMPVMSGLVAAGKIRELEASTNEHIPIIAITANTMLGDKERCISAGMDDYISKPFQPSSLIEIIKKHL